MSANRYDPSDRMFDAMDEYADGGFVTYQDYEKLEADNAALKEENERLKDAERQVRDALDGYNNDEDPIAELVKTLRHSHDGYGAVVCNLRARVAELEGNAARYEWLRNQHWNDGKLCVVLAPKISVKLGSLCPSLDLLDETIDSFIREREPTNEG